MNDDSFCLGVDLGGTKVAAAIADSAGDIIAELTELTNPRGGRHVLEQIIALGDKLGLQADADPAKIRSVVIGVPGAVDPRTEDISLIPNIEGLADCNFLQCLRERFGQGVSLENDVNLAMLGEATGGCARGHRNSAFLALGTGA